MMIVSIVCVPAIPVIHISPVHPISNGRPTASPERSERGMRFLQELLLFGRGTTRQRGVAMRKATEPLDNLVMAMGGIPNKTDAHLQILGRRPIEFVVEDHALPLHIDRLSVHERQIEEVTLNRFQFLVEAASDPFAAGFERECVEVESPAIVPVDVAGKLIDEDHEGERAFGTGQPIVVKALACARQVIGKECDDAGVHLAVLAVPPESLALAQYPPQFLLIAWKKPETKYLLGARRNGTVLARRSYHKSSVLCCSLAAR